MMRGEMPGRGIVLGGKMMRGVMPGRGIVLSGKMMRAEMPGRGIVQIHMYHMSSINHHRDVCCFQFGLSPGSSDL